MAAKKPEAITKEAIKGLLDEMWPGHYHLMIVPAGYGRSGIPDHLACVPVTITPEMVGKTYGMFLGIEAKRSGAKLDKWTKLQRLNTADIIRSGGFSCCVFGAEEIPKLESMLESRFLK